MVLTTGKDAKYIEQPVKVTIDDPKRKQSSTSGQVERACAIAPRRGQRA